MTQPVPGTNPVQDDIDAQYREAGFSDEQIAAMKQIQQAQTPQQYAQVAQAAGLTGAAEQAAAGQVFAGVPAGPVQAPSFEDQLAEYKQKNQALEAQLGMLSQQFRQAIGGLQDQLAGVQASVPQQVDPTTESATKVARAFADIAASDAKNVLRSALHSHLIGLGLESLAKALAL